MTGLIMKFINFLDIFPKEIQIVSIAALPIVELRGAIPVAVFGGMDPFLALIYSVIGSFLPVIPILFLLESISKWLSERSRFFKNFFEKLFALAEAKNKKLFDKWAGAAVLIIATIPLPLFGAWSSALAAFVFKVPVKKAIWLIALGTVFSGLIVLGLTLGGKLAVE